MYPLLKWECATYRRRVARLCIRNLHRLLQGRHVNIEQVWQAGVDYAAFMLGTTPRYKDSRSITRLWERNYKCLTSAEKAHLHKLRAEDFEQWPRPPYPVSKGRGVDPI